MTFLLCDPGRYVHKNLKSRISGMTTPTHPQSSRCWTFRRTHMSSADPMRVLCTRLALPLTLSLPSRLAPRAGLTVDVPTRALWLAGILLRRKKRCASVVGTRTDWVLKGEESGMTTPLLLQYVARIDGGGEIFGFGGGGYKESWPWCSLFAGFPSLFVAPSGEKSQLYPFVGRGQACPQFPAFSSPYFSLGRAL